MIRYNIYRTIEKGTPDVQNRVATKSNASAEVPMEEVIHLNQPEIKRHLEGLVRENVEVHTQVTENKAKQRVLWYNEFATKHQPRKEFSAWIG